MISERINIIARIKNTPETPTIVAWFAAMNLRIQVIVHVAVVPNSAIWPQKSTYNKHSQMG